MKRVQGENQFYRFSKPNRSEYPAMIELFSRKSDDFNLKFETGLTPIHLDESIISLSAILLNDVYYDSLMRSMQTIDGYSVIEIETMILFKIKAWLDLKERFERGEHVDSKNIKKHKNDIFRLLTNVVPSKRVEIAQEIEEDIKIFIEKINVDKPDLKYLEITNASVYDLLEILKNLYTKIHEEIY